MTVISVMIMLRSNIILDVVDGKRANKMLLFLLRDRKKPFSEIITNDEKS
jgi:hypothetical protein